MTIKEIELLTGMERGNIRFYEHEGLITPKRMDNGYRDYSEADLQLLLRIKLLRSLHVSIDEIKELKEGRKSLLETISKQIELLEMEKQGISYANRCLFTVEIKNNREWLNSYDTQMLLASLAFAGAQEEMKIFSNAPERIMENISNNSFRGFEFIESGIVFSSNTQWSGYMDTGSQMLIPDENAKENYFRLQFSVRKAE